MAAHRCRSNCRDCRSTIVRGILPAIEASGSATISKAWRGLQRRAAMKASAVWRGRHRFRPSSSSPIRPTSSRPILLMSRLPPACPHPMLLDLVPVGVLIYRLDRLLYANRAFLVQMGYESLHALEEVGGLDALYVEPGVSNASSTSETGTPVRISGNEASSGNATAAVD